MHASQRSAVRKLESVENHFTGYGIFAFEKLLSFCKCRDGTVQRVSPNSHPTLSTPRNFTFLNIPTIFIHPNDCSTRFRFR
jgi:hypothetical protein